MMMWAYLDRPEDRDRLFEGALGLLGEQNRLELQRVRYAVITKGDRHDVRGPRRLQPRSDPGPCPVAASGVRTARRAPGPNVTGERVAVIVPCFNDGPLLVETVGSIDEQEPVELVVIDDASTDPETVAIVDRLEADSVRVARHGVNRGLVYARATGLELTTAPYVFPLDSDDLAVAGALGRMADRLDADPDAVVCFGDYAEFGTHELVRAVPARIDAYRVAYANEYPVTALFRRRLFADVEAWKLPKRGYEDWNLWMAIAELGLRGIYLGPGELTFRKRFHGERMLHQAKREHREIYQELRELHPQLFSELPAHRRRSDMPLHRKLLYPVVYGGRRRFGFEPHLKRWLDRTGVWTLTR